MPSTASESSSSLESVSEMKAELSFLSDAGGRSVSFPAPFDDLGQDSTVASVKDLRIDDGALSGGSDVVDVAPVRAAVLDSSSCSSSAAVPLRNSAEGPYSSLAAAAVSCNAPVGSGSSSAAAPDGNACTANNEQPQDESTRIMGSAVNIIGSEVRIDCNILLFSRFELD